MKITELKKIVLSTLNVLLEEDADVLGGPWGDEKVKQGPTSASAEDMDLVKAVEEHLYRALGELYGDATRIPTLKLRVLDRLIETMEGLMIKDAR